MNQDLQERRRPRVRAPLTSLPRKVRSLLRRGAAGMTLIEIMVVVIIMGLIASAVGFSVFRFLARSKLNLANQEVQHIRSAIQLYQNDHSDQCPTVDQLVADGQLDRQASTNDPWQHPFVIACDGPNITVTSAGPDGRAGTADDIPQAQGQGGAPTP